MQRLFMAILMMLVTSTHAFAEEGDVSPVQIDTVAVIGVATGGHLPGNMEIKILNGFSLPAGVSCDQTYITTKKASDPDGAMLKMLEEAQTTKRNIRLRITDSPALRAYPGRCSLELVEVL